MSKLRVSDMATEFGIPADEVLSLLRQMEVPVRGQASPLTDDQVARVRARWEREKRTRAERQAAPAAAAPARRRGKAAAKAAPEAPPTPEPVAETGPVRRRKKADLPPAPEPVEEEVVPEVVAAPAAKPVEEPEARPAPARRKAAEAAPAAPAETVSPVTEAPELPPVSAETSIEAPAVVEAAPVAAAPAQTTPPAPPRPASPLTPAASSGMPARPRPVTPGAPRGGRPGQGGDRGGFTPRPVASASPGGQSSRRDDSRGGGARPGMGGGAPGGGAGGAGGAAGAGGSAADRSRRKKGKRGAVDQEAVEANVSRTMSAMRGPAGRRSSAIDRRGAREEAEAMRVEAAEREKKTVRVNEFITVSELAQILKISPTEIVGFAFKNLGLMVTINQRLDFDQIELIAGEFGFQAVREEEYLADPGAEEEVENPEDLAWRPPVVTIMGHVDHGKTSLLDFIRRANVVAGEAGGITQHIGAYHVTLPNGKHITFLDTPGHEAFTAMRARGAQVTDLVILVVAADDGIMPQTVEAISHAKNAGVPLIVAVNKIDLPQAQPLRVKQELLQHGVVLEEFGGEVLSQEISAKQGTNVPQLLEQILLQAEILDLKANPDRKATGAVVEAQLDPGKGPVATVLVQQGTLRVGDDFICGMYAGRVRALLDERGKAIKEAGPATPAQVLGIEGVPMAGDQILVVEDAAAARELAQRRQRLDREARSRRTARGGVSLEDFMSHHAAGETRQLRIVIKADQGGPAEALADALQQLSTAEVQVQVIHRGVGAISESDILLAKASGAIIIGFHVRPDNNARQAAEREGVDIKLYRIIYEAVSDVRAALEGMLRPEEREVILGEAEVREIFKVSRIGTIAGCSVRSGVINKAARVRVIRDGVEVFDGTLSSLRRFKEDVREVREGFECGIGVENFNDIKIGDVIECYRTEEFARTLGSSASA